MFVRLKKIKGVRYSYLVSNTWDKKRKTARQKTLKYLGRTVELPKAKKDFSSFINKDIQAYISENDYDKIVGDLVLFELSQHGFMIDEKVHLDGYHYDKDARMIRENSKPVSLKINEGHMNEHTISNLYNFRLPGRYDEYDDKRPKALAEAFVAAGLDVPKDVFVHLFEKLSK
ncbi:hypothetical protein JW968_05640 [Candidatus Woesearchaeota archaeon]|nr:hypothetical protein [Candidatus Woesearchaeota archaeon]